MRRPTQRNDLTDRPSSPVSTLASGRRLVVIAFFVVLVGLVLYQVVNPFPDQPYIEVPHGDHVHYVPKDRDEAIPLSEFPTEEPGPNERILPDGRVVPIDNPAASPQP